MRNRYFSAEVMHKDFLQSRYDNGSIPCSAT